MNESLLVRLFEHNNWANLRVIQACAALTDEQLDAEPQSATFTSIRLTLLHLVAAQQGYLSLLTVPAGARADVSLAFAELQQSASLSGEGLLSLARGESRTPLETPLDTADGYVVEPWVVVVQAINHATEHREQIKSMLTALGVTPPEVDGWTYGVAADALISIPR